MEIKNPTGPERTVSTSATVLRNHGRPGLRLSRALKVTLGHTWGVLSVFCREYPRPSRQPTRAHRVYGPRRPGLSRRARSSGGSKPGSLRR